MTRNISWKGVIKIGPFSGLRKLMRAARRGKIPDERLVAIEHTMRNVARHPEKFMNAHARRAMLNARS